MNADLLQQIFLIPFFLILSLLTFTFPGVLLLHFLKINKESRLEKFVLSSVVGICLFTFVAYLMALVHLRWIMWIFPLLGGFKLVTTFKKWPRLNLHNHLNILILILVLAVGVIGQWAIIAPSGLSYGKDLYFWSAHGHDGIWHLSLMEDMHRDIFPFQNPEFSNHKLENYHFFVDLFMSEISRIFSLSNIDVYFRMVPLYFSLLLGLASFVLVRAWSQSYATGVWAMVFTYFTGSFGYVLTWLRSKSLAGESIFWVSQPQSVLGNPPQAAAFIIILVFLFCLLQYSKIKKNGYLFLLVFLGGVVVEFKVYAGILVLGSLAVISLIQLIQQRSWKIPLISTITALFSSAIFLPNSVSSGNFLVWEPWWFIRTMVVAPDRLGWIDLEFQRQHYLSKGTWHAWLRIIQIEGQSFLIFLVGNLGIRIIGLWLFIQGMFKKGFLKDPFLVTLISMTLISFIIPIFFVQKGVAYNLSQIIQYFLLFMGFFAAFATTYILKKFPSIYLKILITAVIVILAIPTQVGLIQQFYSNFPPAKISFEEIEALKFLKHQSLEDDVVLTADFNQYAKESFKSPLPISVWQDTGYVSAFSARRTFLADTEQIKIMGYDIDKLIDERKRLFTDSSSEVSDHSAALLFNNFVAKYNIKYVYLTYGQKFTASVEKLNIDLIYQTPNVKLYRVRQNI